MNRCDICKKMIVTPKQCVVCRGSFCDNHVESFKLTKDESETFQSNPEVYICLSCLHNIRGMRSKPQQLWSEEEKVKTKGMAGNIVKILGAAGIALVSAIFFFALWLFKKASKLATKEMGDGDYEIEGHSFSQAEAEGFKTKFLEDNPRFEEEPVFGEESPIINEQPLVESEGSLQEESPKIFT